MSDVFTKALEAIKGLTINNLLTILLLAVVAVPAYASWKVVNDPKLMAIVFSNYEELPSATECTLLRAQSAGGTPFYAISNPFAERNAEFWTVAVRIKFMPDEEAMKKYCAALASIIDFARDHEHASLPMFPGSTRPIFPQTYQERSLKDQ